MPRTTKATHRMTRAARCEAIVDAALATFSRYGYRGATTRQLARTAGITEVTLFRHFPSKETLFGAVLDKYSILPVLRDELRHPRRPGDARATLRYLGRRFLGILKERSDMIRLILSEAATNRRQAQMLFRQGPGRFLQDVTKMLGGFREQGKIRRVNLRIAARAVLGIFFSFMLIHEVFSARESERLDLDRAADELCDVLWFGLRPQHSRARQRKGAKRS